MITPGDVCFEEIPDEAIDWLVKRFGPASLQGSAAEEFMAVPFSLRTWGFGQCIEKDRRIYKIIWFMNSDDAVEFKMTWL